MRNTILAIVIALLGALPVPAYAQATAAPAAKSSELFNPALQEAFKKAVDTIKSSGATVNDRIVGLQDIGKYNVAVAVVARPAGTSQNSLAHDKITEIYYVLKGTGTQVTGTIVNGTRAERPSTTIGPTLSSNSPIQNPKSTRLGPGDIQIIPPGVAHGFTSIDPGGIEYLVFRVDPEHVLALQP